MSKHTNWRQSTDWIWAPNMAQFKAMDADGIWYWHQYEPEYDYETGKWDNIGEKQVCIHADCSLQKRPGT